jgi:hypothetical protein
MSAPKPPSSTPGKKRRMFRCFSYSLVALVLTIFCLPWILAGTPLRHSVVTAVMKDPRLSATVGRASFGWFSPLELEKLEILREDARLRISVDRFQAEKPWLSLARDAPDLGTLRLDRPVVEAVLGEKWATPHEDSSKNRPRSLMTAVVRSAGFKLHSPELKKPVVDLDGVSTIIRIKPDSDGRLLTIDPVRVLEHEELTPELCGKGLHLVAPVLGDATTIEGEISFVIDEFQLPLDTTDDQLLSEKTNIRGIVELHRVKAGLKNPLLAGLVGMVGKLAGAQVPSRIHVAEDTQLAFHVKDDRVYHDGMTFMLPEFSSELTIRTSGSVGFDESLDLQIVVPVPGDLLGDGPLARRLAGQPLQLHVTGTLKKPKFGLQNSMGLLAGVSGLMFRRDGEVGADGNEAVLSDAIVDVLGGLLNDAGQDGAPQLGDLIGRLRARREAARPQQEADPSGSRPPRRGGLFRRFDRQ